MLDYPLNSSLILRKKHAIKKELMLNDNLVSKNIALLCGSTVSEIKHILELFLLKQGIKPNFYESEFNTYFEEAVFENKKLEAFKPDIIYIHTTNKNISSYPSMDNSSKDIDTSIQDEIDRFAQIWTSLSKYNSAIIQNNFELPQHRVLGNLDCYDPRGAVNYIQKLNTCFAHEASTRANLYLNDINYLSASIGLSSWYDKTMWHAYRYALSYEAIPHLAKSLSAIIGAIVGNVKKGLILDLDNTCWGGVIGDDGLNGIAIGRETAVAETYSSFQEYAKTLKDRGIILAACSKNEMGNAQMGFTHPDTVLVKDDFATFEANWDPKHSNILKISDTLNLGLDSFVFIDDNPAERQIVSSNLPMVSVPEVGQNVSDFIDHIDKNYYFETISLSTDDLKRNEFYKNNTERLTQQLKCIDYGTYLQSLLMTADIQPFSPIYVDRITQLINKTNQFNLTTKRYTLAEVEAITNSPDHLTLYGRLKDKFGDNGLVSVLIGRIQHDECHINSWLMSCRVLKRDMEYAMLDTFVSQCQKMGIKRLVGYYYPTEKNSMVSTLYNNVGFDSISGDKTSSVWGLLVKDYINKNKYVEIAGDSGRCG